MNQIDAANHAQHLVALYAELIAANEGYVHDPEAHNLCTAVVEQPGKFAKTYISYSNPSGFAINVQRYVLSDLIVDPPVHLKLINRGGMQDLHTEVRLINYLNSIGVFQTLGVVNFFSTRSVCKTCQAAIADTQKAVGGTVGFFAIELKVEDPASDANKYYVMNTRRGSQGGRRDNVDSGTPMDM